MREEKEERERGTDRFDRFYSQKSEDEDDGCWDGDGNGDGDGDGDGDVLCVDAVLYVYVALFLSNFFRACCPHCISDILLQY